MSDVRTDLEEALAELVSNTAGLAGLKTVETSVRDCLFTGDKLTQGFRGEELPACAITAQLKPSRFTPFSLGEVGHEIPVSVTIVTRAQRAKQALRDAAALQGALLGLVNAARKSGNALGANTFVVGEISASATTIDEKPYSFAISTAEFNVLKVVEV